MLASARFKAITVVSPPIGAAAVAITVSDPPSTMFRAAARRLAGRLGVHPVERVDQHDGVGTAGGNPPRLVDHQLDRVVLGIGGRREAHCRGGSETGLAPHPDLLGPDSRQRDRYLELLLAGEHGGQASQRLTLACPGGADQRHP